MRISGRFLSTIGCDLPLTKTRNQFRLNSMENHTMTRKAAFGSIAAVLSGLIPISTDKPKTKLHPAPKPVVIAHDKYVSKDTVLAICDALRSRGHNVVSVLFVGRLDGHLNIYSVENKPPDKLKTIIAFSSVRYDPSKNVHVWTKGQSI